LSSTPRTLRDQLEAVADIAYEIPHDCDCDTCRLLRVLEPDLAWRRDSAERRWSLFAYKCLMLAGDLETCEALMRGERVPKSRLDPGWAKAYGLR
jgi:hypothetical protein